MSSTIVLTPAATDTELNHESGTIVNISSARMNGRAGHGRQVETITFRDFSTGLGIKIIGGREDEEDQEFGIFVKRILPGGLAADDGRMQEGDQLLELNGESLEGVTNEEAVGILRQASASNKFQLVVTRDEAARQEFLDLLDHHGYYSGSSSLAEHNSASRSTTPSIHAHGNRWPDHGSPFSSGSSTPTHAHSAPIYTEAYQHLGISSQASSESGLEADGPVSFASAPPDMSPSQHAVGSSTPSPTQLYHPKPIHPYPSVPLPHLRHMLLVPTLSSTPQSDVPGAPGVSKVAGSQTTSLGFTSPFTGPEPSPVAPSSESPVHLSLGLSPEYATSSGHSPSTSQNGPSGRSLSQRLAMPLDHNVRLRIEKLEGALRYLGLNPLPEQQAELKKRLSIDPSGTVTYGEFVAVAREVFKFQLEERSLSPGPSYGNTSGMKAWQEFTHPPAVSYLESGSSPNEHGEYSEQMWGDREDLVREIARLKIKLREKERICAMAEDEQLRISKKAQGAIQESRSLRSKVQLAEAAHRASRHAEQDYEEVVRLLETEVSQLRTEKKKYMDHPAVQKRLAVLSCQLKKSEHARKTYEVATEKLLQFAETVHETLSGGGDLPGSRPASAKGEPARGNRPPGYLGKHKRLSPQGLAQEAREVVKTVKSLVEVEPLPFGWDEAYTEDGMRYYINHVTQVTSWTHPLSNVQRSSSNVPRERPQSAPAHTVRATIHETRT